MTAKYQQHSQMQMCVLILYETPESLISVKTGWNTTEQAAEQSKLFCGLPKLVKLMKHCLTDLTEAKIQTVNIAADLTKAKPQDLFQQKTEQPQHTHASFFVSLHIHSLISAMKGRGLKEHAWECPLSAASGRPTPLLWLCNKESTHLAGRED